MIAADDRRLPLLGCIVFVASASMMFVALLFAYSLLREQGELGSWIRLPAAKPLVASVLVVAAAVAIRRSPGAALLLAIGFLLTQALWWRELIDMGVLITESPRSSFVYGLTLLHALHVAVGVIALGALAFRKKRAGLGWVLYWDFVALVWFAIAATLFLIR